MLFSGASVLEIIGSLRNADDDGNESSKKAIGLDKQKTNFARASHIFLPSLLDYNVKPCA